jgi:hypothetical protein
MKVGIFGDSFADPIKFNESENFSWPVLLSKEFTLSKKDCYAQQGTSHWWSYEQFLKNYKKYDTIIFVHTNAIRWPHLPADETGKHWNVGVRGKLGEVDSLATPLLRKINSHFVDIFSDELLNFISRNIYKAVNELCLQHNIQLLNIMPFDVEYNIEDFGYPTLTGLRAISANERVVIDGNRYNIIESLALVNELSDSNRYCHLNRANNRSLATIITDLILTKKNGIVDLTSYDCWATEDENLNACYITKLKNLS